MPKQVSNYDVTQQQAAAMFLGYDQTEMIRKFALQHDEQYLYLPLVGRRHRIDREIGVVEYVSNDGSWKTADFNAAMTIYDLLCYSKPDCRAAGEFINMKSLSAIKGGSISSGGVGDGFYDRTAARFDHKNAQLIRACEVLGGSEYGRGDVAYQIPALAGMPVVFQFWDSDEDFGASIALLFDKNILDFIHYETVWYLTSHLLSRIAEQMD